MNTFYWNMTTTSLGQLFSLHGVQALKISVGKCYERSQKTQFACLYLEPIVEDEMFLPQI